jgi:signal transduction histidine kinase
MVASRLLALASVNDEQHVSNSMERMLAGARAVLAVVSLVAIYLDPTEPRRFAPLAYSLLIGYSFFSLGVLHLVWRSPLLGVRLATVLKVVDVVMAAALTIISEGPSSPFFPLFVFVLLVTAYRHDLRATLITGGWIVGLLLAETLFVTYLWPSAGEPLEANRIIIRCTYLMLVALLVGYLSQREKELRSEALLIAKLSTSARVERGLSASVQSVLDHLLQLTSLTSAALFFHESATARSYIWRSEDSTPSPATPFHWRELTPDEARVYGVELPVDVAVVQCLSQSNGARITLALDEMSQRIHAPAADLFEAPGTQSRWQTVCIPIALPDDSTVRLFLMGDTPPLRPRELSIVMRVTRQVFPVLYNLYLLRRLRTRVGELERARVARELHDGVIQSLLGLEMQIQVLRREPASSAAVEQQLASIQASLHQEALHVRDLMHQMRPLNADARNLLQVILDIGERFRRESGMHIQFVSQVKEVTLPSRTCQELARIVQEALVNVRRHSGASNVVIRFARNGTAWLLSIDDDGRGFDFSGRMGHDALDAARKGPIVIKERARSIGGTLTIDSAPGMGSRLEISLPVKGHA